MVLVSFRSSDRERLACCRIRSLPCNLRMSSQVSRTTMKISRPTMLHKAMRSTLTHGSATSASTNTSVYSIRPFKGCWETLPT